MTLDPNSCYRALASHDPRFDGVFFVGVTTTRIYCRPVCRARLPRADRCRFFPSAAAAEAEGFRPCLRCRPEKAPGRSIVDATGRLARAAAARIAAGAMNGDGTLESLARSLHVSSRQLRRAVRREYGASPVELAQTHRLLLAKRLLTESELSMSEVAFASGFSSVRRFNALFQSRYRMSPTRLRRREGAGAATPADSFTLALDYRPPLDWEAMLAFLAARSIPGVEMVRDGRYYRSLAEGEHRGWVAVGRSERGHALEVGMSLALLPALMPVLARLRDFFDLDAEPATIDGQLGADPVLEPLVQRHPGLRVPAAVDGFELALRGVIGQQVSVRGATTLVGRVAERFGEPADPGLPGIHRYTPAANRIADVPPERLAAVGLPRARAECIVRLARAVADGEILLEPGADVDVTVAALQELPGIGPWTAQYIAMRGLHWPDAFPGSDLGIRKALGNITPSELRRAAERWRPWRAYAAIHLWQSLADAATVPLAFQEVA